MSKTSTVILLAFDIPTENSKAYRNFRKNIIAEGFLMLQRSVYYRICHNKSSANTLTNRIEKRIMTEGNILIMTMGYRQFEKIKLYKDGILSNFNIRWDSFEIL